MFAWLVTLSEKGKNRNGCNGQFFQYFYLNTHSASNEFQVSIYNSRFTRCNFRLNCSGFAYCILALLFSFDPKVRKRIAHLNSCDFVQFIFGYDSRVQASWIFSFSPLSIGVSDDLRSAEELQVTPEHSCGHWQLASSSLTPRMCWWGQKKVSTQFIPRQPHPWAHDILLP